MCVNITFIAASINQSITILRLVFCHSVSKHPSSIRANRTNHGESQVEDGKCVCTPFWGQDPQSFCRIIYHKCSKCSKWFSGSMVEHLSSEQKVVGSSPTGIVTFYQLHDTVIVDWEEKLLMFPLVYYHKI